MINADLLSIYYGGVIVFTQSVAVYNSEKSVKNYDKGEEIHITPAVLHMVATGKIPTGSIKPILRTLDQLEDIEILELSRVLIPAEMGDGALALVRQVFRQGKGRSYTVEVMVTGSGINERSLVINASYDIALSDIIHMPLGGKPIVTQLATRNQIKANRWLLKKHLDVFGLIPKKLAVGRKNWGRTGYETPKSLGF